MFLSDSGLPPKWCHAVLLVVYLEYPNCTPRALPDPILGSNASTQCVLTGPSKLLASDHSCTAGRFAARAGRKGHYGGHNKIDDGRLLVLMKLAAKLERQGARDEPPTAVSPPAR